MIGPRDASAARRSAVILAAKSSNCGPRARFGISAERGRAAPAKRHNLRSCSMRPDLRRSSRSAGADPAICASTCSWSDGREIGEGKIPAEDKVEQKRSAPPTGYPDAGSAIPSRWRGLTAKRGTRPDRRLGLMRCGGNSRKLVAAKHPSCARASMISSMSVATIISGTSRAEARDLDVPQDFQSVRLFARRAAGMSRFWAGPTIHLIRSHWSSRNA